MVRPATLLYFYRKRLRVHAVQELLAGLGIAVGVALVFSVLVVNGNVGDSGRQILHAIAGDATLALTARDAGGFDARMRARVEALPGVEHAASLLEQRAAVAYRGRRAQIELVGADGGLSALHGSATRRIDLGRMHPGLVLPLTVARRLGLAGDDRQSTGLPHVTLAVRGHAMPVPVSAVLDTDTIGPLAGSLHAVSSLSSVQELTGLRGRVTRILVVVAPGQEAIARAGLERLAAGRLTVSSVDEELQAIELAAAPIDQGTTLIAAISVFVGLLFSFTAMLPTLTDRRRLVVALRMMGYGRARVVQILGFQAIVLGVCASAVGLLIGLLLANGTGHDPTGYLTFAFPLSTQRLIGWETIVATIVGGVLASCLAAAQPLLDMRSGSASIAVLRRQSEPMHAVTVRLRRTLAACGLALIVLAGSALLLESSMMIVGAVTTAVAIVLAVPAAFAAILRLSEGPASRWRLSSLTLALRALRATSPLALGLVATGAVAVFGAVGLRGTHASLLHGMYADFRGYLGTADVWVAQPGDDLALEPFDARGVARRVAAVGGVRDVRAFYGGLLDVGVHRAWVIGRPNRDRTVVPASQVVDGDVRVLERRVRAGGWVTVSQQIAAAEGVAVGGTIRLPTPTGEVAYRVAATTTNLGWGPGAVVMNARDYRRAWDDDAPSALEVDVARGADVAVVARSIRRALGDHDGGLSVQTARERVARVSETARDGLAWSGRGAMLLLIAAGFAMSAAIGAGTWQRRVAFGHLRLMGWRPVKLWFTLLWEAGLVLGTGCIVGAAAGAYGHYAGDRWLRRSTDYPASFSVAAGQTVTICLLVFAVTLIVTAVPGVLMSRTPPRAGLDPDR